MKINIRTNVFETNSSSMHSIIINPKNDTYFTKKEIINDMEYFVDIKERKMDISSIVSEFGRDFNILWGFRDKLSFVLADFGSDCIEDITILLKEFYDFDKIKSFKDGYQRVGYDAITGKTVPDHKIFLNPSDNKCYYKIKKKKRLVEMYDHYYYDYGYIDHQSMGILKKFIKEQNISIKEFLMNKKYIIILDSDEAVVLTRLCDSGLIDKNNLIGNFKEDDHNED